MIFIPGNVPSSKNSKISTRRGVFHSKTVKKYLTQLGIQHFSVREKIVKGYKKRENIFALLKDQFQNEFNDDYPLIIGLHLVRDSKRNFDFHNIVQILADLFVAHDFIPDDSMKYVIIIPFIINNQYYSIDKNNCGVYIKNLKENDNKSDNPS